MYYKCLWRDCNNKLSLKFGGHWVFCEEHLSVWMELYGLTDDDINPKANFTKREKAYYAYLEDFGFNI